MAPVPQAQSAKPLASTAIHCGTEKLLALINDETNKATARARRDLAQIQTEFASHLESSSVAQADLTRQLQYANRAAAIAKDVLAKAVSAAALAHAETSLAKKELTDTRTVLEQIKVVLGKFGVIIETDGTIHCRGTRDGVVQELAIKEETQSDDARVKTVNCANLGSPSFIHTTDPSSSCGQITKPLEDGQSALIDWQERCRALEEERDRLKAALEIKVVNLMTLILSVQVEVHKAENLSCPPEQSGAGTSEQSRIFVPTEGSVESIMLNRSTSLPKQTESLTGPFATHQAIKSSPGGAESPLSAQRHPDSVAVLPDRTNPNAICVDNTNKLQTLSSTLQDETTPSKPTPSTAKESLFNTCQDSLPNRQSGLDDPNNSEMQTVCQASGKPTLKRPLSALEIAIARQSKRNKSGIAIDPEMKPRQTTL